MTALTKHTRDLAVAALRQADADGRKKAHGSPWRGEGVCSCVIIAEGLGLAEATNPHNGPVDLAGEELYRALESHGFRPRTIFMPNDKWIVEADGSQYRRTFAQMADIVAGFDVVDEAEAICKDAVEFLVAA